MRRILHRHSPLYPTVPLAIALSLMMVLAGDRATALAQAPVVVHVVEQTTVGAEPTVGEENRSPMELPDPERAEAASPQRRPTGNRAADDPPPIEPQPLDDGWIPMAADGPLGSTPADELELLAVDIARRTLLAYYPSASRAPIRTTEVWVRPKGDIIYTYARLIWSLDRRERRSYSCEVFSSIIYMPERRRMYELSYQDNYKHPHRNHELTADVASKYNEYFKSRDPLMLPHPLIGSRLDLLEPRSRAWRWNPFSGDRGWHVWLADSRPKRRWMDRLAGSDAVPFSPTTGGAITAPIARDSSPYPIVRASLAPPAGSVR